jgi:uncharacterized protein YdaU (DUF1376 family)
MSETPFIKFYASDFLGGTSGLSPAERGVYITLLCLMFDNDGPILRDDTRLARRCGAPKATFIRILEALMDAGKVTEADGMLTNGRAEKALIDRQNRTQNAGVAAKARWSAQAEKTEEKQCPNDAPASATQCVGDAIPEARSQKEDTTVSSRPRKRATRLPDSWVLPEDWKQWAIGEGWGETVIRAEADKFRDYWIARAGKDAAKADWLATWRNWMRNSKAPRVVPDTNPRASPEEAALRAIRSGQRFLCTHIPPSTARALVARGMVTEGECKEVGVL